MNRQEALEAISNGHAIWSIPYTEEVCQAFGVSFPKSLIGVTMYHGPEKGVWSLTLAQHVAQCLGVKDKAQSFLGRDSQAREYARVIREKLGIPEEVHA